MMRRSGEMGKGGEAVGLCGKRKKRKAQAYADLMERLKREWMERGEGMETCCVCVAGGTVREKKEIAVTCMNKEKMQVTAIVSVYAC